VTMLLDVQIKQAIDEGKDSLTISQELGVARSGPLAIILGMAKGICHVCSGKSNDKNGKPCEPCKGVGAV